MRLSSDNLPSGMRSYLQYYGWHFNNRLCDFAVSNMVARSGGKFERLSKDTVDKMLSTYKIELENAQGYDAVYVANMAKADYFGSSIKTEEGIARFVKDYIDDPDGYEGLPMTRYFADIIGSGTVISWEDVL